MGDRRIGGDDQVQALHHGRTIDEGIPFAVEFVAKRFYVDAGRQRERLVEAVVLLQADQADTGKTGKWGELSQSVGSSQSVPAYLRRRARLGMPYDADLESFG